MTQANYTLVGSSIRGGQRKLRYSNGDPVRRGKRMFATDNTEIVLYKLPQAMPKRSAERAYDELFRNRTQPAYASPCFNYDTVGRTPRPSSTIVDQALKYLEENA
jgi:hypothetical protein